MPTQSEEEPSRVRRWMKSGVVADAAGYSIESSFRLLLTALVGILIARYLGPDGLGLLSYANSVFAILAPLSMLGLRVILVREFSTTSHRGALLVSALAMQLPAGLLASLIGFQIVVATRGDQVHAIAIAAALAPLPILGVGDTFRALFEATGRARKVVGIGLVSVTVASVAKVIAVAASAPIWVLAALTSVESLLVLLGFVVGLRGVRRAEPVRRRFDTQVARTLLSESWPLMIAAFAVLLYMRADVLMLGLLADDEATGVYVAAARFSELWYFLPVAAMAAARPRLARLYADRDLDSYRSATQRFMSVAFAVSLGAILVTLLLGSFLIETVYGTAFSAASDVLRIHILAAPFVFLGVSAGQWFIDRGMTRVVMVRSVMGAGVNIVMNLVLIPTYGATGAAVATLVSYALASVVINAFFPATRPVFWMQMRAFRFARW